MYVNKYNSKQGRFLEAALAELPDRVTLYMCYTGEFKSVTVRGSFAKTKMISFFNSHASNWDNSIKCFSAATNITPEDWVNKFQTLLNELQIEPDDDEEQIYLQLINRRQKEKSVSTLPNEFNEPRPSKYFRLLTTWFQKKLDFKLALISGEVNDDAFVLLNEEAKLIAQEIKFIDEYYIKKLIQESTTQSIFCHSYFEDLGQLEQKEIEANKTFKKWLELRLSRLDFNTDEPSEEEIVKRAEANQAFLILEHGGFIKWLRESNYSQEQKKFLLRKVLGIEKRHAQMLLNDINVKISPKHLKEVKDWLREEKN